MVLKVLASTFLVATIYLLAPQLALAADAGEQGRALLKNAQENIRNANMRAADKDIGNAIGLLETLCVPKGSNDDLSLAYYMKANVLITRKHRPIELENLLAKALDASPGYEPNADFITDPRIERIYTRTLAKQQQRKNKAIAEAQDLLRRSKFCDSARVLMPFHTVLTPQQTKDILAAALDRCKTPDVCWGRVQQQQTPPKPNEPLCGVMPVTIQNLPGKYPLPSSDFSVEVLKANLGPLAKRFKFAEADPLKVEQWQKKNGLTDLRDFRVRQGVSTITFNFSGSGAGKGKGIELVTGELTSRNAELLQMLMSELGYSHMLFVFVEAVQPSGSTLAGNMPDVDLHAILYRKDQLPATYASHFWRGESMNSAKNRFTKIGEAIFEELRKTPEAYKGVAP